LVFGSALGELTVEERKVLGLWCIAHPIHIKAKRESKMTQETKNVTNAHEARELTKNSDHPMLDGMLSHITTAAKNGQYSIDLRCIPEFYPLLRSGWEIPGKLKNNLTARGFSIIESSIRW
jgi:hypothetical protein